MLLLQLSYSETIKSYIAEVWNQDSTYHQPSRRIISDDYKIEDGKLKMIGGEYYQFTLENYIFENYITEEMI